ncbi:OFA family MFS transporter [Acidaminobacter sp. JC074]|uniref:L-lactate MFS transporter n=1 Tax=Acidaminobacter sp. JC074 TaxID=2530199 RepID=UPI001F0E9433|nr:OFA family MFS transporter [Acidaminobacter sp. JC074]
MDNYQNDHLSKGVEVDQTHNRWTILLAGFLLSLMGGMSYAWGSFVVPLVQDWGWTNTQAVLPFTVLIIVFAITMVPAGWIQDRIGPRKVATWGAIQFFVGYALSGLLKWFPHPAWLVFSYGFIVGIACGLTYSCIAPTARKWYADRPGFAVSTGVMGFGLAAVVFSPFKKVMIKSVDVDGTFLILSVFVTIVALIGARMMRNPPEGYHVNSVKKDGNTHEIKKVEDVMPSDFIKTPVFYLLWLALAMVIGGGLTAIGLIPAYGEIQLKLAPTVAATAISAYALTNGFGRPIVGMLSDKVGTMRVMTIVYVIQATVFLLLPWVAVNYWSLVICSLLLGIGYATTFALFPVLVSAGFGTKYLGMNYGLVFSAFGIGALTSLMGSKLLDMTNSFTPAFLLAGITTVIGLILLRILNTRIN